MPISVAPDGEPVRGGVRGPGEVVGAGGAGTSGDHELFPVDNQFDGIETGCGAGAKARHGIFIGPSGMVGSSAYTFHMPDRVTLGSARLNGLVRTKRLHKCGSVHCRESGAGSVL